VQEQFRAVNQESDPNGYAAAREMDTLFHPADGRAVSLDRCFLCGVDLGTANRTREHVLPLWLLNRHGLLNAKLTLLNGTSLPYKQLTIPACLACNGGPDPLDSFDIVDNLHALTIAIRIGEVGVIACLQDHGAQAQSFSSYFSKFAFPLHGLQFREMAATIFYKQSLLNKTPKFMVQLPTPSNPNMDVICLPLGGLAGGPLYNEWSQKEFAEYLARYTGLELDQILC
jgi:hypothetical protein